MQWMQSIRFREDMRKLKAIVEDISAQYGGYSNETALRKRMTDICKKYSFNEGLEWISEAKDVKELIDVMEVYCES